MTIERKKEVLKYLVLAALCVWVALISSCYTQKKAIAQQDKIIQKFPAVAQTKVRALWPCVTIKQDTVINTTDTTIMVDCPPTAVEYTDTTGWNLPQNQHINTYVTMNDMPKGSNSAPFKTVRVPVTLPIKTVTIVKEVEDLAQVAEMDGRRITEMKAKEAALKQASDYKDSLDKWRKRFFIALAVIIVLLIPYGIKVKKFFSVGNVVKSIV